MENLHITCNMPFSINDCQVRKEFHFVRNGSESPRIVYTNYILQGDDYP